MSDDRGATVLKELVDEFEDRWAEDEIYGLYLFSWFLNDYRGTLSETERRNICLQAYREVNRRHHLKLVWMPWPTDPDRATDADPDTPLDFELDPDSPVGPPLLALVPAEPDSTSDRNTPTL